MARLRSTAVNRGCGRARRLLLSQSRTSAGSNRSRAPHLDGRQRSPLRKGVDAAAVSCRTRHVGGRPERREPPPGDCCFRVVWGGLRCHGFRLRGAVHPGADGKISRGIGVGVRVALGRPPSNSSATGAAMRSGQVLSPTPTHKQSAPRWRLASIRSRSASPPASVKPDTRRANPRAALTARFARLQPKPNASSRRGRRGPWRVRSRRRHPKY